MIGKKTRVKTVRPSDISLLEKLYAENCDQKTILIFETKGKRDYARERFIRAGQHLSPQMKALLKIRYLQQKDGFFPLEISFQTEIYKTLNGEIKLTDQELSKPFVNSQIRDAYNRTAIKEGKTIAEINVFLIAMQLSEMTSMEYERILTELTQEK